MSLSPALLEILACPEDKGPLYYLESESLLYNPRLQRRYDVRDDIPVMLIPESTTVDQTEHERLMAVVEPNPSRRRSIPAQVTAEICRQQCGAAPPRHVSEGYGWDDEYTALGSTHRRGRPGRGVRGRRHHHVDARNDVAADDPASVRAASSTR